MFTGSAPPVMHDWDIAGGISRQFVWNGVGPGLLGATTIWGGYTQAQDGLGGFTRTTVSSSLSVRRRLLGVGRRSLRRCLPWHPVRDQIQLGDHEMVYCVDQAVDSAALNLFAAYQHIEPEIKLVTRDPAFSPTGTLKNVPITLDDFDVFFMGGRIQFDSLKKEPKEKHPQIHHRLGFPKPTKGLPRAAFSFLSNDSSNPYWRIHRSSRPHSSTKKRNPVSVIFPPQQLESQFGFDLTSEHSFRETEVRRCDGLRRTFEVTLWPVLERLHGKSCNASMDFTETWRD